MDRRAMSGSGTEMRGRQTGITAREQARML